MFRDTNYWLRWNFIDMVKLKWGVASSQIINTNDLSTYAYKEHRFDSLVESVLLIVVGMSYPHTKGMCMCTQTPMASRTMSNRTEWPSRATKLSCASQQCSISLCISTSGSSFLQSPWNKFVAWHKKNEIMPFAAAWICHTEWSKSDRGDIYDIPYMWNPKRNDTNELTYKTETDSQNSERAYTCWRKDGGKG